MKEREERKRFKLNGRFQNCKQIPEVLSQDQGYFYMHEGCFLQTGFSKILNVSVYQKTWESIYFKNTRMSL